MATQQTLFDDILGVIVQCGGGTLDQLTQHVMASGVIPRSYYVNVEFRHTKDLITRVMKQKNDEGIQIFIITPRRVGRAHIWVQLELADLEDCKYKLAKDIEAIEQDLAALESFHSYILERFGIDLALPTLSLLPNQDRWWVETLEKYDDPDGYIDDPDDDC